MSWTTTDTVLLGLGGAALVYLAVEDASATPKAIATEAAPAAPAQPSFATATVVSIASAVLASILAWKLQEALSETAKTKEKLSALESRVDDVEANV